MKQTTDVHQLIWLQRIYCLSGKLQRIANTEISEYKGKQASSLFTDHTTPEVYLAKPWKMGDKQQSAPQRYLVHWRVVNMGREFEYTSRDLQYIYQFSQ